MRRAAPIRGPVWWAGLCATALAFGAHGHDTGHAEHSAQPARDAVHATAPATWPDVAARYRLELQPAVPGAAAPAPQQWHFLRRANELRIVKGDVEEVWRRDARGELSFERIFHADQRRVHYTAGELRTLGIEPTWHELCALVDRTGLDPAVPLQWDEQHQLPRQWARRLPSGLLRLSLVDTQPHPPADWPGGDARARDYLRIDAADLGDMVDDRFARKAEAHDQRMGWREAGHQH